MPHGELFDDLPEKYQVISYKEYTHSASVLVGSENPFFPS